MELEVHQFQRGSASPGVGWYLTSESCDLKNPPCGAVAEVRGETAAPGAAPLRSTVVLSGGVAFAPVRAAPRRGAPSPLRSQPLLWLVCR